MSIRSVQKILDRAADRLVGCVEHPRREAGILLAHVLGLAGRHELHTRDVSPSDATRSGLDRLVAARASGVPMVRLLGYAEFYEDRFVVHPGVFIPRPETELLVERARSAWGSDPHRPGRILELGVGSGAVVVSLLRALPGARGVGVDLSRAAISCAGENAERLGVGERLSLVVGDLFVPLEPPATLFDLIVSNPPYVAVADPLPEEVREHDPALALFAGDDGLDVIERIVAAAPDWLAPGGTLLMEIGETQGGEVCARVNVAPRLRGAELHRDLAGKDRVVVTRTAE